MDMSKHAEVRRRQRGISTAALRLIPVFGKTEKRPVNATAVFLDKEGLKDLEHFLRVGLQSIDKLKGQVVILAEDDTVITCYHKKKRSEHGCLLADNQFYGMESCDGQ